MSERAPAFTGQEMARRWSLARDLMRRHDLGALVVFGTSGVNRHNQANVFWLTNHLDLHHTYLVAPCEGSVEPVLYVELLNHVPAARETSEVPVAWGGYDPASSVASRLRALGLGRGRVGLVGVNATFGIGMPYQHFQALRAALPELHVEDVTAEFAGLRAVKSTEEIARLRTAAALTDTALEAGASDVREGMPGYALLATIEAANRAAGGQPHIAFLRSVPGGNPPRWVPGQKPPGPPLRRGGVCVPPINT